MAATRNRIRNRGVRASRAKVTAAMSKAGIKTQAALAARIAELEGLSEPPRQAVNKVLREQPVDMPTLMRVARALDVQIYALYLTAQEVSETSKAANPARPEQPEQADQPEQPGAETNTSLEETPVAPGSPATQGYRRRAIRIAAACVLVGSVIAAWALDHWRPDSYIRSGRLAVTLGPIGGDAEAFRRDLLGHTVDRVIVSSGPQPQTVGGSVLVLAGEINRLGRASSVRLFTVEGDRRTPFWSAIRTGPTASGELAEAAALVLEQFARERALPKSATATAIEQVMRGLSHLDSSPNELNLRRAQSEFEAALRIDPRDATAQAALCETLVRQSWIRDEQRSLSDAQNVCRAARELDSDAPLTRIAYAHLLERTGRAAESHLLLDEILERHPDNADALMTGSDSALQAFLETGNRKFLTTAEQRVRHATVVEPAFWKTHWLLGRVEFHLGHVAAAVRAYEAARRLDANEYVLGNLGAMTFCSGDAARARDIFLEARGVAANPALGEEYMGLIYYYLQDFTQSTQSRQRALDAMQATGGPEIHQIWGDAADSYRRSGRAAEASRAYARALQIVSNDFSQGNATAGDKAYRAYYRIVTMRSAGGRIDAAEQTALVRDLNEAASAATEPAGLVRAAIAFKLLDQPQRSREVAALASKTCPVYAAHPDLVTAPR